MQHNLSEQEIVRREKLAELEKLGIEAYPAPLFHISHTSEEIKKGYTEEKKDEFKEVSIAGRIMSVRDMGKANFAVLQDSVGKIQVYIRRDDICPGEERYRRGEYFVQYRLEKINRLRRFCRRERLYVYYTNG